MGSGDNKVDKLFDEYLNFVSSNEESESFLKEKGFDPDELVNEGIKRARQIQMQLASQKTEKQYAELKANLLQRAKEQVEKLLSDVSFNLENFIKQENINMAFKNFEKQNEKEIRDILERHYLLKFENELKEKGK